MYGVAESALTVRLGIKSMISFHKVHVERSSGERWQLTACSKAQAQVSRDGLHWAHYYPTI